MRLPLWRHPTKFASQCNELGKSLGRELGFMMLGFVLRLLATRSFHDIFLGSKKDPDYFDRMSRNV